jgi:hypothetical protein
MRYGLTMETAVLKNGAQPDVALPGQDEGAEEGMSWIARSRSTRR